MLLHFEIDKTLLLVIPALQITVKPALSDHPFIKKEVAQDSNKATADYTSPALCTPVTPSRRQAMQFIINMTEED